MFRQHEIAFIRLHVSKIWTGSHVASVTWFPFLYISETWSLIMAVSCCWNGLITCPEKSYRLLCIVVCALETSWMRRPWPTGGCCAKIKNGLQINRDIWEGRACKTCGTVLLRKLEGRSSLIRWEDDIKMAKQSKKRKTYWTTWS